MKSARLKSLLSQQDGNSAAFVVFPLSFIQTPCSVSFHVCVHAHASDSQFALYFCTRSKYCHAFANTLAGVIYFFTCLGSFNQKRKVRCTDFPATAMLHHLTLSSRCDKPCLWALMLLMWSKQWTGVMTVLQIFIIDLDPALVKFPAENARLNAKCTMWSFECWAKAEQGWLWSSDGMSWLVASLCNWTWHAAVTRSGGSSLGVSSSQSVRNIRKVIQLFYNKNELPGMSTWIVSVAFR